MKVMPLTLPHACGRWFILRDVSLKERQRYSKSELLFWSMVSRCCFAGDVFGDVVGWRWRWRWSFMSSQAGA